MAQPFGGSINPSLGAVNYNQFLQGSLMGSQMAAQGAVAQGQAMANLGQMVGNAIQGAVQNYQVKKEQKALEDGAVTALRTQISNNPELGKFLGIQDVKDDKLLRSVVKTVSPTAILQLNEQMKQQQAIGEAMKGAEASFQPGRGPLKSYGTVPPSAAEFMQQALAGGADPNAVAALVNARSNAERSQRVDMVDPLQQAKTLAEIENLRARTAAVGQPNLRDELTKLQIQQTQGELKAGEEKRLQTIQQYQKKAESRLAQVQSLRTQINEAKGLVTDPSIPTTGITGAVLKEVPGTTAFDLGAKLETILANTGFDRLQQMREESPTGGALGQVAVQELVALQNSIASLKQTQSKKQLLENLAKVDAAYKRIEDALSADAGVKQEESIESLLEKYK